MWCNSLFPHIVKGSVREAFKSLYRLRVLGTDGVGKYSFGKQLESSSKHLVELAHKGAYKHKAKQDVLILIGSGKLRLLVIGCLEDKQFERIVAKMQSNVCEPVFIRSSIESQSVESAYKAVHTTSKTLGNYKLPLVLEVDRIRLFSTFPQRKMTILGRFIGLCNERVVGRCLQVFIQSASDVIEL